MNFKCEICFNAYDTMSNKPMSLPCGHTMCNSCLQGMREKRCPYCTREFGDMVINPNYCVMDAVREKMSRKGVPDYNKIIKICVVGESGVGKSSLFRRFCEAGRLDDRNLRDLERSSLFDLEPTIGLDLQIVPVRHNDRLYKVQLWDTSGQEQYRSLASNYLRKSHLVLLTYSLDNLQSFHELANYWIPAVRGLLPSTPMLLVGNKLDKQRQVPEIQLKNLCKVSKCQQCKVSCLLGLNLMEVWLRTVQLAIEHAERDIGLQGSVSRIMTVRHQKPRKSSNCCN